LDRAPGGNSGRVGRAQVERWVAGHGANGHGAPPRVAVVAHRRKKLGGGLNELRQRLRDHGITDPMWFEVDKSRKVPKRVREALRHKPDLVLVWGGDGSVQRAIDALVSAKSKAQLGILPAGTANLLANNLGVPIDLEGALDTALSGDTKALDVGRINGEHFAVMAGTGFDAMMIRGADGSRKDRFGKAAYILTGARNVRCEPTKTTVRVDGHTWFTGKSSCVLVANVGSIAGGINAFDHATPDDGLLDIAVITAKGTWQWARTLTRATVGHAENSPLVEMTQAHRIRVTTKSKRPYELDGGARAATKELSIKVVPSALTVRVPKAAADEAHAG
jgi:YegS/Rv2252/BmrU family lipid kinase